MDEFEVVQVQPQLACVIVAQADMKFHDIQRVLVKVMRKFSVSDLFCSTLWIYTKDNSSYLLVS